MTCRPDTPSRKSRYEALDLLRELEQHGCKLLRHGSRHDIYWNPLTGKYQPIPRHTEVDEHLARHIKRHLLAEE